MRYSAIITMAAASVALASPLERRQDYCTPEAYATVNPCPGCPVGQCPDLVTITTQGQACSTYIPLSTMCHENGCTTAYEISSYNWVSTVIPCYGNGIQCTVTDEWEPVTISATQTYSVGTLACPTVGVYTYPNGDITAVDTPTTVYYAQPMETYYVAPFCQLGKLAMPGYQGSGLCESCENGNSLYQDVLVQHCINEACYESEETWEGNVYTTDQEQSHPYSISHNFESNGIYGFPTIGITIDITNAPTVFVTTGVASTTVPVTVTSTTTSTATNTATNTSVAEVTIDETFVINISPAGNSKSKREVSPFSGYLGFANGQGLTVHGRSNAARFTLTNGVLTSNGNYVGVSSDDVTVGSARFTISTDAPDFYTTFSAVADGPLTFANTEFTFGDGVAFFCASTIGGIFLELTSAPDFPCTTLIFTIEIVATPATTPTPSASADPSGDLDSNAPLSTGSVKAKREFKDSKMVRRGGLFRSPMRRV